MSFARMSRRTLDEIIADPGTSTTEECAEHASGVVVGVTARAECQVPVPGDPYTAEVVVGPKIRARYYTDEGMIASAIIELPETIAEGVETAVRMVLSEVRELSDQTRMIGVEEAAHIYGVKPSTFRGYVARGGYAPKPDQMVGRTPRWHRSTILEAAEARSRPRHHLT